jgi:hypothetical protein
VINPPSNYTSRKDWANFGQSTQTNVALQLPLPLNGLFFAGDACSQDRMLGNAGISANRKALCPPATLDETGAFLSDVEPLLVAVRAVYKAGGGLY